MPFVLIRCEYKSELKKIEADYEAVFKSKKQEVVKLEQALAANNKPIIDAQRIAVKEADLAAKNIRTDLTDLMQKNDAKAPLCSTTKGSFFA